MLKDFRLNLSNEEAANIALCEIIQDILMMHCKSYRDFILQNPQNLQQCTIFMPAFYAITKASKATAMIAALNIPQRKILNKVRASIDSALIM